MIVPFEMEYALYVCRNLGPVWVAEIDSQSDKWDPVSYAILMNQVPGIKYACLDEQKRPVAVGGVQIVRDTLGSAYIVATEQLAGHGFEIARFARRCVRELFQRTELLRIQAQTNATGQLARRWIEACGLHFESEMKAFGKYGEPFFMWAITREEWSNGRSS